MLLLVGVLLVLQWQPSTWSSLLIGTVSAETPRDTQDDLPESGAVIVVMKDSTTSFRAATVATEADITPTQIYGSVFTGFAADLSEDQVDELADDPNVAYIIPDIPFTAAAQTPSVGAVRTGITTNSYAAVDGGGGDMEGVNIAILDTGINTSHEDLNVGGGYNCTSTDTGAYNDDAGHGSHVAGIAAARDNGVGVVGAAPGARLWAVKVLTANLGGSLSTVTCGIDWVLSQGGLIDVVNMSLTANLGGTLSCTGTDPLYVGICEMNAAGIVTVVAAGNSGADNNTTIPARYDNVISVSSITDYDGKAGGLGSRPSTCGETALGNGADDSLAGYSNYGSLADYAAPGTCIYSAWKGGSSAYAYDTGTSMSAPFVTGAVASYAAASGGVTLARARAWLNGTATTTKGSANGYSGRNGGPLLYFKSALPTGTQNISFSGGKITPKSSMGSSGTSGSARAWDNNTGTSWYTTGSSPSSAWFQLDLGLSRSLTGVRWKWRLPDGADRMIVQTSMDGSSWTTVGTYTDGDTMGVWYGVALNRSARYVKFTFQNPNGRPVLGYISEVDVWGSPLSSYSTGTVNASFSGVQLAYRGGSVGSSNGSGSGRVRDGSTGTSWYTVEDYPTSGWFRLDLGESRTLTGVRWMWRLPDGGDQMVIETSADGTAWSYVGTYTDGSQMNAWYGVNLSRSARYIRFTFLNPNNRKVIGYVSEVQVWGATDATYPTGTLNQSFTGSKLSISSSVGSSNGSGSARVWDGSEGTSWYTVTSNPTSGYVRLDLGAVRSLTGIRWKWRLPDGGDQMIVETSENGSTWRSAGTFSNGTTMNAWYGIAANWSGRYVRITFMNPNNRAVIGYISEVQIWGASTNVAAAGVEEPTFPGAPLAIVNSVGSSNGTGSALVRDGDPATSWYTTDWYTSGTIPTGGWFRLDLGSVRALTGIKWMWQMPDGTDQMAVEISDDGKNWTLLGNFTDGDLMDTWYGISADMWYGWAVDDTARYVRFTFENPVNRVALGYISEVQVWGDVAVDPDVSALTPGTEAPQFDGWNTAIVSSESTNSTVASTRAWDGKTGTSWYTDATTPTDATICFDLGESYQLHGVKWLFRYPDGADHFIVETSEDGSTWTTAGEFTRPTTTTTWYGTELSGTGRYVRIRFLNPYEAPVLGYVAEVEIWAEEIPVTPTATVSSATENATPAAASEGTPVAGTPTAGTPAVEGTPVTDGTPVADGTPATDGTIVATEETDATVTDGTPAVTATVEASPTVAQEIATETIAPTATDTLVETAVASSEFAVVTGTDGAGVRCRTTPSTDGDILGVIGEGELVEVTGAASDGWTPVRCADGDGFVATDYLALVGTDTEAEVTATADAGEIVAESTAEILSTAEIVDEVMPTVPTDETAAPTEVAIDEPTLEPTAEPTIEPTPTEEPTETPIPVVAYGDSEQTQYGIYAIDDDPNTWWSVVPWTSPTQVELVLDLGQTQAIERLSFQLAAWNILPYTEIWLSTDGVTWWNAVQVDGFQLQPDVDYELPIDFWARYVKIVVPHADQSGLGEIGGLRQISIWADPYGEARSLDALGQWVTPEPLPTEPPVPTEAPLPTEVPVEVPTEAPVEMPTEAPVEEVLPTDEPAPVEEVVPPTEEPAPDASAEPAA